MIYLKQKVHIKYNNERLQIFPLKSRSSLGCYLLLLVFTMVLEVLPHVVKHEWLFANYDYLIRKPKKIY